MPPSRPCEQEGVADLTHRSGAYRSLAPSWRLTTSFSRRCSASSQGEQPGTGDIPAADPKCSSTVGSAVITRACGSARMNLSRCHLLCEADIVQYQLENRPRNEEPTRPAERASCRCTRSVNTLESRESRDRAKLDDGCHGVVLPLWLGIGNHASGFHRRFASFVVAQRSLLLAVKDGAIAAPWSAR
jgi:hypothetical protein